MTSNEIEKLFDKTLELNLANSLFKNDLESYKVSGILKSSQCQGFDLELLKPPFSLICQEKVDEEQNTNFSYGDRLYHVINYQGNREILLKGFIDGDWVYKEDKYVLQ